MFTEVRGFDVQQLVPSPNLSANQSQTVFSSATSNFFNSQSQLYPLYKASFPTFILLHIGESLELASRPAIFTTTECRLQLYSFDLLEDSIDA
jgi:hypothetical protein